MHFLLGCPDRNTREAMGVQKFLDRHCSSDQAQEDVAADIVAVGYGIFQYLFDR